MLDYSAYTITKHTTLRLVDVVVREVELVRKQELGKAVQSWYKAWSRSSITGDFKANVDVEALIVNLDLNLSA